MSLRTTLAVPLAWRQLRHEPGRLAAAVAGIAFAVVLVFMQFGFNAALFESNVRIHSRLVADLVLVSPRTTHFAAARSFPRRRVYQAAAIEGVESVAFLRAGMVPLKDPVTGVMRDVLAIGLDPTARVLDLPEIDDRLARIRRPDTFVFDRAARPEFAPTTIALEHGPTTRELGHRRATLDGLFTLGTSFGIDAVLVGSDANFRRVLPTRTGAQAELGLVRLAPGADPAAVRVAVRAALPDDVEVLTKPELVAREKTYWREITPIGYVISVSLTMAWVVGAVFVYQVLYTTVAGNLASYATLKAMGFGDAWLFGVVVQQAVILAVLAFLPGLVAAAYLYQTAGEATRLPMELTLGTALLVLGFTVAMCATAGALAARPVRHTDPADLVV